MDIRRTVVLAAVLLVAACGDSGSPTDEPPSDPVATTPTTAATPTSTPQPELRQVEPESVGWSSAKLVDAATLAEEIGSAAVLAMHNGDIFFSWGETDAKLRVHSIRKPFLNALYGIHVEAGDINLDATLEELGIDDTPPVLTDAEKQATVRDLLMARSGVYHPAHGEAQEMIDLRPERGSHPPDTFFYYNNWDFNALGTIFEQETGLSVCEAFGVEIAEVIGMEDFVPGDCQNVYDLNRSIHPVYQFSMTARDMARFGLLYLRDGRWDDEQVIPQGWIEESWTLYSVEDPTSGIGYGYLWGVTMADGALSESIGHQMYWHTGLGVHVLAVIPDLDLVIVHRVDTTGPFSFDDDRLGDLLTMVITARD